MPYAVVLFFDPDLEKQVAQIFRDISVKANVPKTMPVKSLRPHITLGSFEDASLDAALSAIRAFAEKSVALDIRLDSVGTFSGVEGAVFLAPTPCQALLTLHLEFYRAIRGVLRGPATYYLADQLVFHCTVGHRLDDLQVPLAVAVARQARLPLVGKAASVGFVEFPSVAILGEFQLARQ